jgi:two-component SAPR family response regulator
VSLAQVIKVRTLGRFDVTVDGDEVTRWRAGKARNLLQYLLLNPGRIIPRDALFEALWPGLDAPRSSLKVAIHTLRSILVSEGVAATRQTPSGVRIVTHEYGYSMELKGVWVDFQEFDSLIRRSQSNSECDLVDESAAMLRAAVDLYQGDFLPGATMPWVEPQREWLRSIALAALHRLVQVSARQNDRLQLLQHCKKILEIEPTHEQTYRTIIRLHGELGEHVQADRWFRICTTQLREQLGVDPDEETRMTHGRAVRGELVGRARCGVFDHQSDGAPGLVER